MKGSPCSSSSSSPSPSPSLKTLNDSPKKSPGRCNKYLRPGALAKLRDSKIIAKNSSRTSKICLSELLSSATSQEEQQPMNEDNGIPCFEPTINLHRPRCLLRKQLFPVTPSFTPTDTDQL